ncbi:hypothetical protein [Tropicimonas sp. IMCC6043]|uniref:hypothetical protein n=1 Tax=Tropicimonas sp. IMCC6043 TaxID=2510645 RepID=UPI00101C3BC7|nr:hypothetical protein [Tropicimonas sp. IMCC6043]RYH09569.1 hypothetical protein EU800_11505 [Tropicimonas sp. IMCC6043]
MIPTLRLHLVSGGLALATIATFWTSTVLTELFRSAAAVATVKSAILWGFALLIPALATAGITGNRLARGRSGGLVTAKRRRMAIAALNGLLILVPAAILLARWSAAAQFDATFALVQAVELAASAANVTLLALNLRDGRKMSRARRRVREKPAFDRKGSQSAL